MPSRCEMDCEEDEPDACDEAGWRHRIEMRSLSTVRSATLVRAVHALGIGKTPIVDALVVEISTRMKRILKGFIGRNHPNEGRDLVEEAHWKLLKALLTPGSADGQALRTAFFGTVKYRAADAIRKAGKDRSRFEYALDEDDLPARDLPVASTVEETAHVESILRKIKDDRKRLAYRLHMDGAPRYSKTGTSIASALGVSAKTAETWVREVEDQIRDITGETS